MPPLKNLIGQKFDMLTVIDITDKRQQGSVVWECQCDCGNICERSGTVLHRKGHHSCGCWNRKQVTNLKKKDLSGERFGKLIALEATEKRASGGCVVWKCECDCGNIVYIPSNSLTTRNTQSCGCINYSIGEKNIDQILTKNHILFTSQYTEKSLNKKKFDFAIFNDKNQAIRLIEFDGIQHFNETRGMWNSQETAENIQARDQEKNEWAVAHNIPLVRIPYWERDNITLDMLLGDQYLVKGSA